MDTVLYFKSLKINQVFMIVACPFLLYVALQGIFTLTAHTFTLHTRSSAVLEEDSAISHLQLAQGMFYEYSDTGDGADNTEGSVRLPAGLSITGNINRYDEKFAIISASLLLDSGNTYKYAFPLPLTVLSWKRVGYRCIVVLIGTKDTWMAKSASQLILDKLIELDALVVFMDVDEKSRTMFSQTSRIFVPALLGKLTHITNNSYVITSDADLWPVNKQLYDLPEGSDVISLNSECCGRFSHKGDMYKMLPMANIGMTVRSWITLILTSSAAVPINRKAIKQYLKVDFGGVVDAKVSKGENIGWYLDQRMISVLIKSAEFRKRLTVHYKARNTGRDRIDRSRWHLETLNDINDSHILENCYLSGVWLKIMPLIKMLFSPAEAKWCESYQTDFLTIFKEGRN